MALPATISHTGSLSGSPASGSIGAPSLQEILNTSWSGTYGSSKSGRPGIVNATDLLPFTICLETITKVRVLIINVKAGTMKVLVTSAAGIDQAFSISNGNLIMHMPAAGDELTSVKLVGTADIEYVLAGDVT